VPSFHQNNSNLKRKSFLLPDRPDPMMIKKSKLSNSARAISLENRYGTGHLGADSSHFEPLLQNHKLLGMCRLSWKPM